MNKDNPIHAGAIPRPIGSIELDPGLYAIVRRYARADGTIKYSDFAKAYREWLALEGEKKRA